MDQRFRYGAAPSRRSPPLHNTGRASVPVNINSTYASVYGSDLRDPRDPREPRPVPGLGPRYEDPITPRTQNPVDYRAAPSVPTPPQLFKAQPPTSNASVPSSSQPVQPPHHHHASALPPRHTSAMPPPPPPPPAARAAYTSTSSEPLGRSTSLRDPPRPPRQSFNEHQKRPIIVTTTTGASAGISASAGTARAPPSPTRADFRPPSADNARDHYYAMPATSAGNRSRGSRYSYSGTPISASMDSDELSRLRERHDFASGAGDLYSRARHQPAYANAPRTASGSLSSGVGSAALGSGLVSSSAASSGATATNYGDKGYEYTKPGELARYDLSNEHAGARRGRRGSIDRSSYRPTVSLTTDLSHYPYDAGARRPPPPVVSNGPPPTTWGFDKLNRGGPSPASTGSLAPPSSSAAGTSSIRSVSRQRPTSMYQTSTDPYRGRDDELVRDRRGPERGRDYHDRDYRDRDRDHGFDRELDPRDREAAKEIAINRERDLEWERERAARARDFYADGSSANRGFSMPVNSREHPQRHPQHSSQETFADDRAYRDEYRDGYRDDSRRRDQDFDRRETRGEYTVNPSRSADDRVYVRGRQEPPERLGIEPPRRKETDDDMYVHHPQEDPKQWEGDRRDDRDRDREREKRERERERIRDRGLEREAERERERELERERARELEREQEKERERERAREKARERDREHDREPDYPRDRGQDRDRERERDRGRDHDRDRDHDHGHDHNHNHDHDRDDHDNDRDRDRDRDNRADDRDTHTSRTGVATAATVAAVAGIAASGSDDKAATKKSRRPTFESSVLDKGETSRSGRLHSPDWNPKKARRRDDDGDESDASHSSHGSTYTVPVARNAPSIPNGRTPTTSEDEDSDSEAGRKESGAQTRRKHSAPPFERHNTEDLKALKEELAALDDKDDKGNKESKSSSSKRNDRGSGGASPKDEDKDLPVQSKSSKSDGADKDKDDGSPRIMTPPSTSSSDVTSPNAGPSERSSKGTGRDRNEGTDKPSDTGSSSDKTARAGRRADDRSESRRGREPSQPPSKAVVRVVSPPRNKEDRKPLKGILKQPKTKFPEEANPVREGVAPHKDDKTKQGVPPGARWTRISRKLVNPEALTIGKERFEARDEFVIVLRVLSHEEIEAYTIATAQLREKRRKEFEQSSQAKEGETGRAHGDYDDEFDDDRRYHHGRMRDKLDNEDYNRHVYYGDSIMPPHAPPSSQRDRDRDRDRDRRVHHRHVSETYADEVADPKQSAVEYYNSHGSNRPYYRE